MTEEEQQEWQERLRAAVAETLRKRAERRAERADHLERRRHGKATLHAIKLTRIRGKSDTEKPPNKGQRPDQAKGSVRPGNSDKP